MDWNNEKVLEFIQNYAAESVLWDPRDPGHKKKRLICEAWIRIKNNLSWCTTVDDLKKKRDSLMAYYRIHLNKIRKCAKSGGGVDVYQTNWFAFSSMNSFLRPIYDCQINTQILNEKNEHPKHGNEKNSHLTNDEDRTPDINATKHIKRSKIDLPSEILLAKKQMQDAFEHVKGSMTDECEMFGKLIASKLRKLKNENSRDILMNDIHNMVFQACMLDRVSQQTVQLPQSYNQTNQPLQCTFSSSPFSTNSPYNPTCPSPHSPSSPQSSHKQIYQSPPYPSSPQSPEAFDQDLCKQELKEI